MTAGAGTGRWTRRVVSLPAVVITLVVATVLAPLWVPASILADVVLRRWRLPTLRVATFVWQVLVIETLSMLVAFVLWLALLGRVHSRASQRVHSRMQWWWAGQIAAAGRRSVRLRFDTTLDAPLSPGPVIAVGRHASYADAILPALLFGTERHLELRYVLAAGLAWDPCLDVYGHRLRNHFVDRAATDSSADIDAIAGLVTDLGANDAAVIFPEGRFFTPARRERGLDRLRATDPALAARAASLRNVLPPRPGGTLAMLRGAPDADVVVIAHTGLEQFVTVRDIWRNAPLREPVRAQTWRHPRHTLPTRDDELVEWLYDQWHLVDRWIDEHSSSATHTADRDDHHQDQHQHQDQDHDQHDHRRAARGPITKGER